jgi:hypothetical protein
VLAAEPNEAMGRKRRNSIGRLQFQSAKRGKSEMVQFSTPPRIFRRLAPSSKSPISEMLGVKAIAFKWLNPAASLVQASLVHAGMERG